MAGVRSYNVLPSLAANYFADGQRRHVVLSAQHVIGYASLAVSASNVFHLLFSKFALAVSFALMVNAASFVNAIIRVVFLGAKKQMSGIAARRIVASMKHKQSSGDKAKSKLIGYAMRANNAPLVTKYSISVGVAVCGPRPTIASRIDFRPETLIKRFQSIELRIRAGSAIGMKALSISILHNVKFRSGLTQLASETGFRNSQISHAFQAPILNGLVRLERRSNASQAVSILA